MSIQWLHRVVIDKEHDIKVRIGHSVIFAAEKMFVRHFLTEGLEHLNDHKNLSFTIRVTEEEWNGVQGAIEKMNKQAEVDAAAAETDGVGKKGDDDGVVVPPPSSSSDEKEENQEKKKLNDGSAVQGEEAEGMKDPLAIEIPPTTYQLLSGILEYAAKGHCVYPGDTTRLDPERGAGLFGRQDFRAIMYAPCPYFDIPEDVLHGVPITWREYQILERFGPVRAMAALGSMFRFYPTAPWIDINRQSFLGDTEEEQVAFIESAITHKMKLQLQHGPTKPGSYCYLEAKNEAVESTEEINNSHSGLQDKDIPRTAMGKQTCTFYYNDNFVAWIRLNQDAILHGGSNGLGIQTSIDPEAKRIMVYKPGSNALTAISHPNAPEDSLSMLGNYVYFATPGPGETPEQVGMVGGRLIDDGFLVFCNFPLAKLLSKMGSKETITIDRADMLPKGPAGEAMLEVKIEYDPSKGGLGAKPGTEIQQKELEGVTTEATSAVPTAVSGGGTTPQNMKEGGSRDEEQEEEDSRIVPLEIQLGTPDEGCTTALAECGQEEGMAGIADAVNQLRATMITVLEAMLKSRNETERQQAKEAKEADRKGDTSSATSSAGATPQEEKGGGVLSAEKLGKEMELLNGSTVFIMVELQAEKMPSLGLAWGPSKQESQRRKKKKQEEAEAGTAAEAGQLDEAPYYLTLLTGQLQKEKEEGAGCLKVLPSVAGELKFRCAFGINL